MSAKQQKSETNSEHGFHHSLGLLDEIRSWAGLGGALTLVLLPAMIVLLCFPSAVFLESLADKLMVGALLGLIWVASAVTMYRQRASLTVVRRELIEQMDAATKNSAKAERFYGLSILDPLTKLYNRRFGETRLEEEIAKADGTGDPLLLMAMDFDRFKQINDTLGHDAGDLALKEFSRRLQRAVRACDVPIRVGGDEFLVILPDCPLDKIQTIMSRMDAVEFVVNGKRVSLWFSYGIAQYQVNDTTESLIKRADQRLYEVKSRKKAARASGSKLAKTEPSNVLELRPDRRNGVEPPAGMPGEKIRRSVRLPVERPVSLMGSDLLGRGFSEATVTLDVSRHGAAIMSAQKLAADQEMIMRCLGTNQEAEVRVVRAMESNAGDFAYGLAFVDPEANIWGEFPPTMEADDERNASLFACSRCRSREVLEAADARVGDHPADTIIRTCRRCNSETTWVPIGAATVSAEPEAALSVAGQRTV